MRISLRCGYGKLEQADIQLAASADEAQADPVPQSNRNNPIRLTLC